MLVTVFCTLSTFAGNLPKQVNIYAAIEQGGSQAMRRTVVVPISNEVFAVQPEENYSLCTNFQFFFYFPDVTEISSFHLRISRYVVNSFVTDANSALGSQAINLYKYTTWFSGQTAIRTATTTERTIGAERAVYEWTYTTGSPIADKNAFGVIIPFQSFVWSTNQRILFCVEALSVNGSVYNLGDLGDTLLSAINGNADILRDIYGVIGQSVGEVVQFDPSVEISNSYNEASQAFQNDVNTFSGFINQYNMRTTSERVMFPALLTLSTAGGDLSIILAVSIAACSAGSLIFALRRLHG